MVGQAPNRTKATSLIFSGSVSSLSLFLQEMDVDRMHDDVKTEALAAAELLRWASDNNNFSGFSPQRTRLSCKTAL